MRHRHDCAVKDVNSPPPYNAILPVRANSWFLSPFFSTNCCAIVSPVANNTAVVTLCVKRGLEANFIWYLKKVSFRTSMKIADFHDENIKAEEQELTIEASLQLLVSGLTREGDDSVGDEVELR